MKKIQQLFVVITLAMISFSASAFTPPQDGKVILIVTLEVKNYTEWKKGFDAGTKVREEAGIKVLSICQSLENENQIIVIEEAESAQKANEFMSLIKAKQASGDMSKVNFVLYNIPE